MQVNSTEIMTAALSAASLRMRDVWAHNLDEECALVREVVRKYPYIAMDTEFPGVVRLLSLVIRKTLIISFRLPAQSVRSSTRLSFTIRHCGATLTC